MKKIKRITLEIWSDLLNRVDEAAIKDGFNSRSEFLRFLIITYLKKEHPNKSARDIRGGESEVNEEGEDEFANVDLEFGIPPDVIEKIKQKAAEKMAQQEELNSQ